jgi:hypothetical protein
VGSRGLSAWQCLALGGLLLAPMMATSSGSPEPTCSLKAPAYTIIGPLVAVKGSTATFSIDSVEPFPYGRSFYASRLPPVLAPEQTVAVRYESDHAKFLVLGYRYRAVLIWTGSYFWSDVHMAGRRCQAEGTRYSDMREIDIPTRSRSLVLPVVIALGLGVAGATGFLVVRARRSHGPGLG